MKTPGNDISRWQDDISTAQHVDFAKMWAAGSRFVFIKVSQSTWADRDFVLNWENARSMQRRGGYHFLSWDALPVDQARFFCGLLRQDPGELPPVLDYENRTNAPSREKAIARARIFVQECEQLLGRKMIVYTSPSYWREFGDADPFWELRKLWIAHYGVEKPTVPAPWIKWTFWQYGEGKGLGLIHGAESLDIDMDWYNGSLEEMDAEFNLSTHPVEPIPPQSHELRFVNRSMMNIRTGPGITFSICGQMPANSTLIPLDVDGSDTWIQTDRGWICKTRNGIDYLEKE
jgi:lysozyme